MTWITRENLWNRGPQLVYIATITTLSSFFLASGNSLRLMIKLLTFDSFDEKFAVSPKRICQS